MMTSLTDCLQQLRAAFKAGVRPSRIAREFGRSKKIPRDRLVLALISAFRTNADPRATAEAGRNVDNEAERHCPGGRKPEVLLK